MDLTNLAFISIGLATKLYAERLLDRDHYLDWMTCAQRFASKSESLMWVALAQTCQADMVRSRKYGCRFAYFLLDQLRRVSHSPLSSLWYPSMVSILWNSFYSIHSMVSIL